MDNYNQSKQEHAFDWEDEIKQEQEYVLLPEGDYDFIVTKVVKGRFEGSEKMPACPKAMITLTINFNGKQVPVQHNLFLHSSAEWRLSEFFASIGKKKKGEPLRMNWNVEGLGGKCQINHRTYNNNTYNNVKKLYAPWERLSTQQTSYQQPQQTYQQPSYQQPQPQKQSQGNWNTKGW